MTLPTSLSPHAVAAPAPTAAASQAGATINKVNIVREEMAMRRKLILRPQSLTM